MLPAMPNNIPPRQAKVIALRGINYSDNYQDGHMESCKNISARRYPYMATRRARRKETGENITAIAAWNDLFKVSGKTISYGSQEIGELKEAGEKQLVMVNTKLVIWPDKMYVDMNDLTLHSLEESASYTGAVFTENTIKVTGDATQKFAVGEAITISGCTVTGNDTDMASGGAAISDMEYASGKTTITCLTAKFTAGTETGSITFSRPVPDLDFICESENRIWGCSNKDKTIYACALGDPKTWYDYSGESTDSYAVAVGSRGDFTGCTKFSSSVLFWKENTLHKLLGSYPEEYTVYTYEFEGVKRGCSKSLQLMNETLFYVGVNGVYAYAGGNPVKISAALGNISLEDACSGTDTNKTLYLSAKTGEEYAFMTYDLDTGIWLREDATHAVDFATLGKQVYFCDASGFLWLENTEADDSTLDWEMTFKPVFETVSTSSNSTSVRFEHKRYAKLIIRMELPEDSVVNVYCRYDKGEWQKCGTRIGRKEDMTAFMMPITRCDQVQIRITGTGPCTILNLLREYREGSYK